MHSRPKMSKKDGRPKATAGIMLYTYSKGKAYILIGREKQDVNDPVSSGKYSEFSGSVELKPNHSSESFLEGSIRELEEETAGTYRLDSNYIIKNGKSCYQKLINREVMINFVEAPFYTEKDILIKNRNASQVLSHKEKDDFMWIKAEDLLNNYSQESCVDVHDIEGNSICIKLRSFLAEMLKDKMFKHTLQNIINNKSAK
ncbi:hypothetical protein H1Q59_06695 [Holosporaceae bacterium 'Namur']|nr:hypothetical protein [Holosporaceae bacterium 'Namur']